MAKTATPQPTVGAHKGKKLSAAQLKSVKRQAKKGKK
jgi:hypothetical protein